MVVGGSWKNVKKYYRKGLDCTEQTVNRNMELYPVVTWKAELENFENEHLAEEISKLSVEGTTCFMFPTVKPKG